MRVIKGTMEKDGKLLVNKLEEYETDGKVIKPLNNEEIIIVGGIFDGETMTYDEMTGNITWQNVVYKPILSLK